MPNPVTPRVELPIEKLAKLQANKNFGRIRLSGDGSADHTLRNKLGGINIPTDKFQASITSTDAQGKETKHPIFNPRGAGVDYSAADNSVDKESQFSLDTGYGADHTASLNGDDTLTLTNKDRAATTPIPSRGAVNKQAPIRSSTVTIAATGDNNTVKIAEDFTGKVILKNPANTKVTLANGDDVPVDGDKTTTLYFKNGKPATASVLGIETQDGVEIPKPPAAKPNEPKVKLLQAA